VVFLARFDGVLDRELTGMSLPPATASVVGTERGKVLGADFSSIEPVTAEALRRAFAAAYVAGFRTLMLLSAAMAAASALGSAVLVAGRVSPHDAAGRLGG
jgi:hypothetical protein